KPRRGAASAREPAVNMVWSSTFSVRLLARRIAALLCASLTCAAIVHAQAEPQSSSAPHSHSRLMIQVYETSDALHEVLRKKPPLLFRQGSPGALAIHVDDSLSFQQIDGFGASLTDASAWLLAEKLTSGQRRH